MLQGTGAVPSPGGWLAGSAGPGAVPAAPAGAPLADFNAAPDSPTVPGGAAAALAIAAAPHDVAHGGAQHPVTPGNQLRLAVLAPVAGSAAISVNLGDGSQLAAKLTALATLLAQAEPD